MLSVSMLSVAMLSIIHRVLYAECHYAECRYAECRGTHHCLLLQFGKKIASHCDLNFDLEHFVVLTSSNVPKQESFSIILKQ